MKSSVNSRHIGSLRDSNMPQTRTEKLTPEMCKAIRRQELGIDYWRTGFHGSAGASGGSVVTDRKPAFSRISHIDLYFPGAFLPNVTTGSASSGVQTQTRPLLPQKPKHRNTNNNQALVLNRSRTSLTPGLSSTKTSDNEALRANNRKNNLTDLTCLQLADTLFATRRSQFATSFFNLTPSKNRPSDNMSEDKDSDDESVSDISDMSWPKLGKRLHDNEKRIPRTLASLKYQTFQPADCIGPRHVRHGIPLDPGSSDKSSTTRPQKSILKNGFWKQTDDNDEGSASESEPKTCNISNSYRLSPQGETSGQTDEHITLEYIRPKISRNRARSIVNDLRPSRPIGSGYSLNGMVKDLSVRKRSVRFNSSHEIREYTPHEPVYNC